MRTFVKKTLLQQCLRKNCRRRDLWHNFWSHLEPFAAKGHQTDQKQSRHWYLDQFVSARMGKSVQTWIPERNSLNMRARENDAVHFHFHPSIGNYLRSVSGKFSVWKKMIIWNNEALQISLINGLSDPGNRKPTFQKIKTSRNETFWFHSESRKPYQRTRVRYSVCKEDEICETNFRYESAHKCSTFVDWAVVVGVAWESLKLFSAKIKIKSSKISWFEFVDVNWRYSCTNDLTFKRLRNMRDTTIETRRKSSHRTYHSCTKPPKIVHSRAFVVCVVVVLKTLLITDRMKFYSQRVTLSLRTRVHLQVRATAMNFF